MKKYILFTGLCLMCSTLSIAQEKIETYQGQMNKPKEFANRTDVPSVGKGMYEYYVNSEGVRIKHGKFSYEEIEGQFENGKQTGSWKYSASEAEGYRTINYVDGKISGQHKGLNMLRVYTTTYHTHFQTLHYDLNFKDGHYYGKSEIMLALESRVNVIHKTLFEEDELYKLTSKYILSTSFNDNGWADGLWVYEDRENIPIKHEMTFYEGILLSYSKTDLSSGDRTPVYNLNEKFMSAIKDNLFDTTNSTIMIDEIPYARVPIKSLNDIDIDNKAYQAMENTGHLPSMLSGIAKLAVDGEYIKSIREKEAKERLERDKEAAVAARKRREEFELKRKQDEEQFRIRKQLQQLQSIRDVTTEKNNRIKSDMSYAQKKPIIISAYNSLYRQINSIEDNLVLIENLKTLITIQDIVFSLYDAKTKDFEKKLLSIDKDLDSLIDAFLQVEIKKKNPIKIPISGAANIIQTKLR